MHLPRVHTTARWIDQGDSILGQLAGLDVNPGPLFCDDSGLYIIIVNKYWKQNIG